MQTNDGDLAPAKDDRASLSPVMRTLIRALEAGHAERLCAIEANHQIHLAALNVVDMIATSITKTLNALEVHAAIEGALRQMEDKERERDAALKLAEIEWQSAFEELGRRIESLEAAAAS